jgi:flagellar basal-body rod protein FlgB
MAGLIDKALGVHVMAVEVRARRAELLAANLANADTPRYKAKDIDFRAELARIQSNGESSGSLVTTHRNHLPLTDSPMDRFETLYRVPQQPSLDGNTVEAQIEQVEFMQNALQMQGSLRFLDGRIKGLMTAIRGE